MSGPPKLWALCGPHIWHNCGRDPAHDHQRLRNNLASKWFNMSRGGFTVDEAATKIHLRLSIER